MEGSPGGTRLGGGGSREPPQPPLAVRAPSATSLAMSPLSVSPSGDDAPGNHRPRPYSPKHEPPIPLPTVGAQPCPGQGHTGMPWSILGEGAPGSAAVSRPPAVGFAGLCTGIDSI